MEHLMEELKSLRDLRSSLSNSIAGALKCQSLQESDIVERLVTIAGEVDWQIAEAGRKVTGYWLGDDTTPH